MWLGTCIGKRNYHYFYAFVGFLELEVVVALILCFANIRMHWAEEENGLVDTLKEYPLSFGLIAYGAIFGAFVTVLFLFHTVLISDFKTT